MSYILGLSFDYHDSAAAILKNGIVLAAAEEERFSRVKHDNAFPVKALAFCLEHAGITREQITDVAFYENTFLKFDRIVFSSLLQPEKSSGQAYLSNSAKQWWLSRKIETDSRIRENTNFDINVHNVPHHEAHAAAAFFNSGFEKAAILTVDGVGEYETCTISLGEREQLTKISSVSLPNSIGLFYSAFTAFLGFEVNEGEYKVMGMSAYGCPEFIDEISPLIKYVGDGKFTIEKEYFNFETPIDLPYTDKLIELLGQPRPPEENFDFNQDQDGSIIDPNSKRYANIASTVQKVTEDIILDLCAHALEKTKVDKLCLAGGVALNSVANAKIKSKLDCDLYVYPAAGDGGSALGAALRVFHYSKSRKKDEGLTNPFLGKEYSREETISELIRHNLLDWSEFDTEDELTDDAAQRLFGKDVVGWMQGRFEWGPRALGNRSILANPMGPETQALVNSKIKFRELFRPFAPAVIYEEAEDFFDLSEIDSKTSPENFMLSVVSVKKKYREIIPAVTHVDGSARVQIVKKEVNPLFHQLLTKFGQLSGVPILLNTSFNLKGEPMVAAPYDALETFSWSGLECLYLGKIMLTKDS